MTFENSGNQEKNPHKSKTGKNLKNYFLKKRFLHDFS